MIDKAISIIEKNKNLTGLRSVYEMSETAWKTFHLNKKSLLQPIVKYYTRSKKKEIFNLPRQKLPLTFFGQGYVDIINTKNLKIKKLMVQCFDFSPDIGEIDNYSDYIKIKKDQDYKNLKIFKYLIKYEKKY